MPLPCIRSLANRRKTRGSLLLAAGFFVATGQSRAVMFYETGDPGFHTSTPGDNSGWQYEGNFLTFLGVPIAPHFFITAKHFGGSVGNVFNLHGDLFTTIAMHDHPDSDLRIWEVDHAKPFLTYAPLSSGDLDIGAEAAIFGRGTRRGDSVSVGGEPKGWKWGPRDDVKRWGRNVVAGTYVDPDYGELLYCNFDKPGIAGECHLSVGDSGGGLFVLENGLWRLAGIHLSVDGPFRIPPVPTDLNAVLFDKAGFQTNNPPWTLIPEQTIDIPSSFYSTRISEHLSWILEKAPEAASLAPENYSAWLRLYFSPSQISDPDATGPLMDPDVDGISNLLEFSLNLDPTFNHRPIMDDDDGLHGLPLVRLVEDGGSTRLTMEFVRRTATSGADVESIPEFSPDAADWQNTGTTTVESINPRWERVRCVDSVATSSASRRFARLRVVLDE